MTGKEGRGDNLCHPICEKKGCVVGEKPGCNLMDKTNPGVKTNRMR
jgi:hypothetical protein